MKIIKDLTLESHEWIEYQGKRYTRVEWKNGQIQWTQDFPEPKYDDPRIEGELLKKLEEGYRKLKNPNNESIK